MRRLTKHFSYDEMTSTTTGLSNIPDEYQYHNLYHLATILESVRAELGHPLTINSAFRSLEVNEAVNGSPTSYHLDGRAADISTLLLSPLQKENLYVALDSYLPVELIIHNNYVHVAY